MTKLPVLKPKSGEFSSNTSNFYTDLGNLRLNENKCHELKEIDPCRLMKAHGRVERIVCFVGHNDPYFQTKSGIAYLNHVTHTK